MNPWPGVVFSWLLILLALVLPVLGMAPRVGWLGFMIPVLLLGSGVAVRYRRVEIAWLLLVPVVAVAGWVTSLVMGE